MGYVRASPACAPGAAWAFDYRCAMRVSASIYLRRLAVSRQRGLYGIALICTRLEISLQWWVLMLVGKIL